MEKRKEVEKNNLMLYFYEGEDCDFEEGLPVGHKSYLPTIFGKINDFKALLILYQSFSFKRTKLILLDSLLQKIVYM